MAIEEAYIRQPEVPYHVRKYIETELKMYKAYLSAIHLIDEELGEIYQSQPKGDGAPVQGGIMSNQPLTKTLKIETLETEMREKLSRVHKIEEGLKLFPPGSVNRRIIEVKYFSGNDWSVEQIMAQVGIGRRNTYFEKQTFILKTFGIIFKVL